MSQRSNTQRIDEILLWQGLISEDQIKEALKYQREHGGRFGSHLVRLGFVSEEDLLDALSQQFGCESVLLSGLDIPPEIVAAIPAEVAAARTIMPFAIDEATNTLHVACEDPTDEALLDELLFVVHDKNIRLFVAADMSLRSAVAKYYVGAKPDDDGAAREQEPAEEDEDNEAWGSSTGAVLVVSDNPDADQPLKMSLEVDGYEVDWIDSADDAIHHITERSYRAVFIRDTVPGDYIDLIDRLRKVSPRTKVRYYETAARMLLDEVGWIDTGELLSKNMQLFTTLLASRDQTSSNHASVVGRYVEKLCRQLGLPARDRLQIINAAYLHDISRYYYGESKTAPDCRARVQMTAKLLDSIGFHPLLVGILKSMYIDLEDKFTKRLPIEKLGGNILTIVDVFCEHASFEKRMSLDKFESVRANLISLTGRLFLKEVSVAFITMIEKEILVEPDERKGTFNQVLMYCQDADYLIAMAGRLKEEGFRPVSLDDLDRFVEMYNRSRPDLIVLLQEGHAAKSKQLVSTLSKKGIDVAQVPTFLVTSSQATPELANMIELGLEDVIPLENSLDLLLVKLQKLRARFSDNHTGAPQPEPTSPGVTQGNLEDMNLVDLLQAMGPSGKTARIRVTADVGKLTVYLRKGQVVRAESDRQAGAEAVYEAVCWQTGQWVIQPLKEDELPDPNNETSNEALLMEGCRRMDEQSKTPAEPSS